MNIQIPVKVRGRFKIEAVKADGSRRLLADWFDNLVTDTGLNLIGTSTSWLTNCFVGSGNTAPANSDTSLVSLVATAANVTNTSAAAAGSSPYFGTRSKTFRFAIGTATGNLSEIGVGPASTTLFSRALILDGLGAPTTITVLSTEALDVTYQFQQYVPLTDVTGTVSINAVSYAYTVRAASATSANNWAPNTNGEQAGISFCNVFNGAIGAITATPAGSSASNGGIVNAAYSAGSHQRDATISFGLTDGNVAGGITAALLNFGASFGTLGQFQVGFTPAIPKDSSHTMTLTFRQSWARH